MSSESTAEAQKVIDRKILTAIQILSETLNALRNGADEATMANVEAWIENNKAELGQRISDLSSFLGLPVDPDEDPELNSLMQPIVPDLTTVGGIDGQDDGNQPQGDQDSPNPSPEEQIERSSDTT